MALVTGHPPSTRLFTKCEDGPIIKGKAEGERSKGAQDSARPLLHQCTVAYFSTGPAPVLAPEALTWALGYSLSAQGQLAESARLFTEATQGAVLALLGYALS